jgi:LysM repeat protein
MTERGLPSADASPACPFVAFEDDRDGRADRPDHRHRCFAEGAPAPRALAHQEAYCLSSAFPVCPVFQQWARREAAQARPGEPPPAATVTSTDGPAEEWVAPTGSNHDPEPLPPPIQRNPPRDWAAPPPWASGAGAAAAGAAGRPPGSPPAAAGAPDFLTTTKPSEGQGLAGSSADRLARGGSVADGRSTGPDPELAGLVAGAAAAAAATPRTPDERIDAQRTAERDADLSTYARSVDASAKGKRPSVSSTRSGSATRSQRESVQGPSAPSWEQSKRYEAYPQIRAAASLPGIPRVAVLAGALALTALVLFFLPALFGLGGDGGASPSASPSQVIATATPEPTPTPDPTPQTYVIQEGDTLSRIAQENGLSLEELLAANTETIDDPDQIKVGDEIIIPIPVPEEVGGGSAAPSEEPTPEP